MLFLILDKPVIDPYCQLCEVINNMDILEYSGINENEYELYSDEFYSELYIEIVKNSENSIFYIIGSILSFIGIIYFVNGIAISLK